MAERDTPQLFKPKVEPPPWSFKDVEREDAIDWLKEHHKTPITKKTIRRTRNKLARREWKKSLPRGRDLTFSASDNARDIIYGEMRVGGTVSFLHVRRPEQKNYLHHVFCVAGHQVDSFQKVWIDNIEITLPGPGFYGWATGPTGQEAGTPEADKERNFVNKVFVSVGLGTTGQAANSDMLGLLNYTPSGETDPVWTSSHRGRNVAYAYFILVWDGAAFGDGEADVEFLVRGKKVYDPRTTLTAYSSNAALCLADYLMDPVYGMGCSASMINMGTGVGGLQWAANICDEDVPLAAGGTEKRYAINGRIDMSQSRQSVLEEMCSAMAGTISFREGVWSFFPGKWYAATGVQLTEADLRSAPTHESLVSRAENFNSIRGTYSSATNKYEDTDFPSLSINAYVTEDNNEKVWEDISLPLTTSGSMAQRIAKVFLEETRRPHRFAAAFSLKALQLVFGDVVELVMSRYGFTAGMYWRVEDLEFKLDGLLPMVWLDLRRTDANAYNWDETRDEQAVKIARRTTLPGPTDVAPPTDLTLASDDDYLDVRADGTVFSRIYVTWTAPDDPFVTDGGNIEVQYKKSADSSWRATTPLPGDVTHTYILDVKDKVNYDVRIRAVNALGHRGAWVTSSNHYVIGKSGPPSQVPSLTATAEEYGIEIEWGDVSDLDLKWYELRYDGGSWDGATLLTRTKANTYVWKRKVAGTYTFRIKAIDTSGNYSLLERTATLVVSAPAAPTVTSVIEGEDVRLSWTAASGSHAVREYEIRHGDSWGDSTLVARVNALAYKRKVDWSGFRNFLVAAIDVAGNTGSAGTNSVTITSPGAVQALSIRQIDNNVLIDWEAPATGTLPVAYYQVYKGATFAGATLLGKVDGSFAVYIETLGGNYKYWARAVDSAGNAGPETGITRVVYNPPDYILKADQWVDADGATVVDLLAGEADGLSLASVLGPVDEDETWTTHFTEAGYDQVQDFIDAGYSTWLEPVPTSASLDYTIDLGVVVPNSTITLSYSETVVGGTVTVTPTISYKKLSGDSWTAGTVGDLQVWATDFQYIRVQLAFSGSTNKSIKAVDLLRVVVSVKKQTDSGTSTSLASGGKRVDYNLDFLDITHISVTPKVSSDSEKYKVVVNRNDTAGSQYFEVWIFTDAGTQVAKNFSWSAEGMVNVIS